VLDGLNPTTGALLVVDVQRSFGDPDYLGDYGLDDAAYAAIEKAIWSMDSLIESARLAGVPVIWIELASDPANPWGSSNWLRGRDPLVMADDEPCQIGTPGAEWFGIHPKPSETRIRKRHYSGFHETELLGVLKDAGIEWVTVVGLTTECCVASTANDAMQYGFPVLLPTDASAAYEVRIHENAVESLALSVARLTTVAELVAAFPAPPQESLPV
jgi:nicotinamidase-related amidase